MDELDVFGRRPRVDLHRREGRIVRLVVDGLHRQAGHLVEDSLTNFIQTDRVEYVFGPDQRQDRRLVGTRRVNPHDVAGVAILHRGEVDVSGDTVHVQVGGSNAGRNGIL